MLQLQQNNLITGGESSLFYFSIMDHKLVEQIMQDEDSRMMVTISASDLREFAASVAENVGKRYAEQTVSEIKAVMGDKMRYCTRKEAMELLGIKSCATLPMWAKKGYLVPCKGSQKNFCPAHLDFSNTFRIFVSTLSKKQMTTTTELKAFMPPLGCCGVVSRTFERVFWK